MHVLNNKDGYFIFGAWVLPKELFTNCIEYFYVSINIHLTPLVSLGIFRREVSEFSVLTRSLKILRLVVAMHMQRQPFHFCHWVWKWSKASTLRIPRRNPSTPKLIRTQVFALPTIWNRRERNTRNIETQRETGSSILISCSYRCCLCSHFALILTGMVFTFGVTLCHCMHPDKITWYWISEKVRSCADRSLILVYFMYFFYVLNPIRTWVILTRLLFVALSNVWQVTTLLFVPDLASTYTKKFLMFPSISLSVYHVIITFFKLFFYHGAGKIIHTISAIQPKLGEWQSALRKSRKEEVVLDCLRIDHTRITHSNLLNKEEQPVC